jgi:hypothetical protein
MKIFSKKVSLYHSIYVLFCITGCLWYIFSISSVYLEYETNIYVIMDTKSAIYFPMINICYETRSLLSPDIDWTQRRSRNSDWYDWHNWSPKELDDIVSPKADLN